MYCTKELGHSQGRLCTPRERGTLHTKMSRGLLAAPNKAAITHSGDFGVGRGGSLPSFLGGWEIEGVGKERWVSHTRGSLFFTRRTIFTDSSSKSSSILSGRGGRTGSKFFWATVSCTMSMACQESKRSDGPAPELPGIRGPWPSSDLGGVGGLGSHARETTTQRTEDAPTQNSPFPSLPAERSPRPLLQGNMSGVGRPGLCDYPEVGGGQQLEQLPLVAVHGGGLQLLHHLWRNEAERHMRLPRLQACWESPEKTLFPELWTQGSSKEW